MFIYLAGSSLVLTGAAAGNLGGHLYLASKCSDEAERHRQNANERRQEAEKHRSTKRKLEKEITTKEREIDSTRQTNSIAKLLMYYLPKCKHIVMKKLLAK